MTAPAPQAVTSPGARTPGPYRPPRCRSGPKNVLSFNPAAAYISLTRHAIMASFRADAARCAIPNAKKISWLQACCHPDLAIGELWLAGIGWAVVAFVAGVLYFRQAETRYGRG
jgi:hypothetical protein